MISCFSQASAFEDFYTSEKAWTPLCNAYKAADTTKQLSALRGLLTENKVDYYIIPSGDSHGSEYVANKDRRQLYMTGFTGESSTAIVSLDDASLFVDGRYHLQAAKEIDDNWTLFKVGLPEVLTWTGYLETIPAGSRIGLDATLFEISTIHSLNSKLQEHDIQLISIADNLVDEVWSSRPKASSAPLILQAQFAGQPSTSKIAMLRKYISDKQAGAYVVSNLAETSWLLNLRGADIPFSPVFESYILVDSNTITLFVDLSKITEEVSKYLKEDEVIQTKNYEDVWQELAKLKKTGTKTLLSNSASFAVYEAIGPRNVTLVASPIEVAKSIKNTTELDGIKAAHIRDGVAWATWVASLERKLAKQEKLQLSEWDAAEELTDLRKKMPLYMDLAYENISATGGNAAIIHYSTGQDTAAIIDVKTPYLNDSGANYRDGTIDCTRTYHFGKPTPAQKRAYTRVLQGHIQLAQANFPEGTTGSALDAIARRPLWLDGLNYLHGTGHGVGAYLNVHEGPHRIASLSSEPLRPGQITSIEPGYYEADKFGIRIESIYLVKEVDTPRNFGGKWYGFERITQVPIQTALVDWKLLDKSEKRWLKQHNKAVVRTILPLIPSSDKKTRAWLKRQAK